MMPLFQIVSGLACLFCLLFHQCCTGEFVTVPGINVPADGSITWGHQLINQSSPASIPGKLSCVDEDLILIPGHVVAFYVAICPVNSSSTVDFVIRFQIWQRVLNSTTRDYNLLHELRAILPNRYAVLQIPVPQSLEIKVSTNVRLGWTVESLVSVICYNFKEGYNTYNEALKDSGLPAINGILRFTGLSFPGIFSLALQIDTNFVGATGFTGPTGPPGNAGANGVAGQQGPAGATGATGNTGFTGATGVMGQTGFTGPQGETGAKGQSGLRGETGPTGQFGATGATGPTGWTGQEGPIGHTGLPGATGLQGATGFTGPAGLVGATGMVGAKGDFGPTGPPGPMGPAGNNGQSGIQGFTGATGPVGATGAAGPIGAMGVKGDKGDIGLSGPPGPAGLNAQSDDLCGYANCSYGCMHLASGFKCLCATGYQLNSDGHTCSDKNECQDNNGGCEHVCINNNGSFSCSCWPGFRLALDMEQCIDIDECSMDVQPCQDLCINTVGSYHCSCHSGYTLNLADNRTCRDINECSAENGGCEDMCNNTFGSFVCSCASGFTISPNKRDCIDIDECRTTACSQICVNTYGSYQCIQLSFAFFQNGDPGSKTNTASFSANLSSPGIFAWLIVLTVVIVAILAVMISISVRRLRNSPKMSISENIANQPSEPTIIDDCCKSSSMVGVVIEQF